MRTVHFFILFFLLAVLTPHLTARQLVPRTFRKPSGRYTISHILSNLLRGKKAAYRGDRKPVKREKNRSEYEKSYEKNNNMFKWKKYEDNINILRDGFIKQNYFDLKDVNRDRLRQLKNQILNMKILELNKRHYG